MIQGIRQGLEDLGDLLRADQQRRRDDDGVARTAHQHAVLKAPLRNVTATGTGGTGARLMTTLLHALEDTGGRFGLQTMCEGGGQANVTIIERL